MELHSNGNREEFHHKYLLSSGRSELAESHWAMTQFTESQIDLLSIYHSFLHFSNSATHLAEHIWNHEASKQDQMPKYNNSFTQWCF